MSNNMLRKKIIIPIIIITILIIIVSFVFMCIENSKAQSIYIFNDISECKSLDNIKIKDGINDRYIESISYNKSYVGSFKYKSYDFELFAYEFESSEGSKEYFENCTDISTKSESNYKFSSGSSYKTTGVVINGKNAYYVSCSAFEFDDVMNYLSTVFSFSDW